MTQLLLNVHPNNDCYNNNEGQLIGNSHLTLLITTEQFWAHFP